jgi:hypothetical protein
MRRVVPVLLTVSLMTVGLTAVAHAATPVGQLRSATGYLEWSATIQQAVSADAGVAWYCNGAAESCTQFTFGVNLPRNVWSKPGGVQVSIDWGNEDQDLDMYVYGPDGSLAAQSNGVFASSSESVRINSARNGTYTVRVSPRLPMQPDLRYRGLVEVEYAPAKYPIRDLLPNLHALRPRNVHTTTADYYTDAGVPIGANGCYPEEIVEQGAQKCLRFDQIVANLGVGPFELRYRMEGLGTEQNLIQRIYRSDGTFHDRKADTYEFHPVHAHFHYKNFARSKLYKANADGTKGKLMRTGKKNGFCMVDVEDVKFGSGIKGEAPRTYYFPRCNAPTEHDETGTYMTNGISPGWADVYNWYLADQMIEITGIAPGRYVLETVVDPANTVVESNESDQTTSVLVRMDPDGSWEMLR